MTTTLPSFARLPINRCNLPAVILGSLTFQRHPTALFIDGVKDLHGQLFHELEPIQDPVARSQNFTDYMRSAFLLDNPEQVGMDADKKRYRRDKADYQRLLRGWIFNPDGLEAAVLKGWVESRFGLIPRNHKGPIRPHDLSHYDAYRHERSLGLYNSNALESQLDLLYCYCQYEMKRREPHKLHQTLYRGVNRIQDYEVLSSNDNHDTHLILNNLNSFSSDRERADEFGDSIIETEVPVVKLLYFPGLLEGVPRSELEYLVIGGAYSVVLHRY
jgi:NAD+--dinitrogen-reductase ADP-D-ribosyltransferase